MKPFLIEVLLVGEGLMRKEGEEGGSRGALLRPGTPEMNKNIIDQSF